MSANLDDWGRCRKHSDINCVAERVESGLTLSRNTVRIEELISFKGAQYPKPVILNTVYFYVRFPVSHRDREEVMAECGINLDHVTLNRWVEKYASVIAKEAHRRKSKTGLSWRMDQTYAKVRGAWAYLYRALDNAGKTLDFMLSERGVEAAATAIFVKSHRQ